MPWSKLHHKHPLRDFPISAHPYNKYLQNPDSTPASILAANPLGHVVRSPSRDVDTVDSGLLSVVERQQIEIQHQQLQQPQHGYSKSLQQHSPRYNNATNTVGIHHSHRHLDTSQSRSIDHSPSPIRDECGNARTDALSDLMANLSNGSDKLNNSPNSAWQVLTSFHVIFKYFARNVSFQMCFMYTSNSR